jgi:hypothetical protein
MRSLDDILIGFIIFFILERVVKLLGSIVIEPWIRAKMSDEKTVKNWVQAVDIMMLFVALLLVIKYQKPLANIAKVT